MYNFKNRNKLMALTNYFNWATYFWEQVVLFDTDFLELNVLFDSIKGLCKKKFNLHFFFFICNSYLKNKKIPF